MLQYITAISNNEGFCCYVGLSNLLKSRSIYQPTEHLVTEESAQCSLNLAYVCVIIVVSGGTNLD